MQVALSGVTAARGSPPAGLSRIEKPRSPSSSSGSEVTRSTLASGGASALSRSRKRSTVSAGASTSTTTPRESFSTCPATPSSSARRYT